MISVQFAAAQSPQAGSSVARRFSKPKVRAITAFVRLDPKEFRSEKRAALLVLRKVRLEFETEGYSVEDLRVTTQPLLELIKGMSDREALAILKNLDSLSKAEGFLPNVGPAMLR